MAIEKRYNTMMQGTRVNIKTYHYCVSTLVDKRVRDIKKNKLQLEVLVKNW